MKAKRKQSFVFFCIFVSVLFFSPSADTFAQKGIVSVSVEGGLGFRSLRGNEILDNASKSDLSSIIGIGAQYGFSKNYSLKTGLNFQKKGAKASNSYIDISGNPKTSTTKYIFNYLTLPVLFKGTYGDNVEFFFNLGPFLGILLSSDIDFEDDPGFPEEVESTTDNNKAIDFGITAGAGIIIPLSKKTDLSFEIRDDLGLVNISDAAVYNNGTVKTNTLNFILGIIF